MLFTCKGCKKELRSETYPNALRVIQDEIVGEERRLNLYVDTCIYCDKGESERVWKWAEDRGLLYTTSVGAVYLIRDGEHSALLSEMSELTGKDVDDSLLYTLEILWLILEEGMDMVEAILKVFEGIPLYLGKLRTDELSTLLAT